MPALFHPNPFTLKAPFDNELGALTNLMLNLGLNEFRQEGQRKRWRQCYARLMTIYVFSR